MLTVVCVLKSGGDYSPIYVEKLASGVAKHLRLPHKFICYTDTPSEVSGICQTKELTRNLKGWWSKVEIFNETGLTLYFDLDTFILDSIDPLAAQITQGTFCMLTPFSPGDGGWASGIMAWGGDYSYLNHNFSWPEYGHLKLDQRYITRQLDEHKVRVYPIQAYLNGVRSYKFECLESVPYDTSIVCFHGKDARPHNIKEGWVKEEWNAR